MIFLRPLMMMLGGLTAFFSLCIFLVMQVRMGDVVALVDTGGKFDVEIVLYDARTAIRHTIVDSKAFDWRPVYSNLAWSPDGRFLAFLELYTAPDSPKLSAVGLLDLVDFEYTVVESDNFSMTSVFYRPLWISDKLLFMTDDVGSSNTFYRLDGVTASLETVTYDDADVQAYVGQLYPHNYPSPDGRQILIENWAEGDLVVNDEVVYQLQADEVFARINENPPVWSPDSRWVLFSINKAGRYQIMRLHVRTGHVEMFYQDGRNPLFRPANDRG